MLSLPFVFVYLKIPGDFKQYGLKKNIMCLDVD